LIKIREALESDLVEIHVIEKEMYPTPWSFSFFKMMHLLKETIFIVATENDEIMGYSVGEVEKMGKPKAPIQVGHVLNVAVSQNNQQKGIGSLLLDEIEGRFIEKEAEMAYLEVRESNTKAQTIYKKRGYQYVRTSKGYYGDEDGFIMMKTLTR
jgi:ribosomal-protein-alanine N-acetyltransferase